MSGLTYLLAAIGVAAGVTFLLRAVPFVIKGRLYGSKFLSYLGSWMPVGAMVILMIYAVTGVEWGPQTTNIAYGCGIVATLGMHLWRKNIILSIVSGTLVCVLLSSL